MLRNSLRTFLEISVEEDAVKLSEDISVEEEAENISEDISGHFCGGGCGETL